MPLNNTQTISFSSSSVLGLTKSLPANEDTKDKSKKDMKLSLLQEANLISGDTNCKDVFECMIWFELGKMMQKKQRNVFYEHIKYLKNLIRNLFDIMRTIIMWYLKLRCRPNSRMPRTMIIVMWMRNASMSSSAIVSSQWISIKGNNL